MSTCYFHLYKKSTSSSTSFLSYYKDFANLLFWVIWTCLAMPTTINRINLQESLMFICKQKTSSLPSFLRYCKDITNLLLWVLWAYLATMTSKNDTISLQKTLMFIFVQKKSYLPFASFLKYYRGIANLFLVLWTCLATPSISDSTNL